MNSNSNLFFNLHDFFPYTNMNFVFTPHRGDLFNGHKYVVCVTNFGCVPRLQLVEYASSLVLVAYFPPLFGY